MLEGRETTSRFNDITGHHDQQNLKECSCLSVASCTALLLALYTFEIQDWLPKGLGSKDAGVGCETGPMHRQPKPTPSPSSAALAHANAWMPHVLWTGCTFWPITYLCSNVMPH